jgi:hypothetical protein
LRRKPEVIHANVRAFCPILDPVPDDHRSLLDRGRNSVALALLDVAVFLHSPHRSSIWNASAYD